MSDKRTGKKIKRAAAPAPATGDAASVTVSAPTQPTAMKKKRK